jgi:hypothetical protein
MRHEKTKIYPKALALMALTGTTIASFPPELVKMMTKFCA